LFVLSPASAAALVLATLLHGLASRDYATLAIAGRVGSATAIRNFAWAGAFTGVALLSSVASGPLVFAGPFVLANLVTWLAYRRLAGPPVAERAEAVDAPWWARASGWATLARSSEWPRYRTAILDLLGFTLAAAAITSLERVLLDRTAGADELSLYCGAADVALRIQVIGSALSATIYPTFAKLVSERGEVQAARQFLRVASWVVSAYFVGLLLLLALDTTLLDLLLGPAFAESRPLFVLLLIGVFVHSLGYLLTPWQRARGDFATPRASYIRAAVVMLAVGCLAVPAWGALGAVIAYLSARTAELQLALIELRRMPRHLHAGRKFALAGVMFAVLTALCLWRFEALA
jgi:O-antigen/teichoic acid export membrane protein